MRRYIALVSIISLLLCGCGTTSGSTGQPKDIANANKTTGKSNTAQPDQNKQTDQQSSTEGSNNTDSASISDDGSVEILVQVGKTFLSAAYSDDGDGMINLCDDVLGGRIDNNRKLYIGTKPNYVVEKLDITIKPTEEKGKYLLYTSVDTVKKSDKKKYTFKYSIQIEKNKAEYFVTDFKTM